MRRGSFFTLVIIWLSLICAAFLQVLPLPPFVDDFSKAPVDVVNGDVLGRWRYRIVLVLAVHG